MSALFDDFAEAADYARHLAASSNQVVSVLTDWDQWIVKPLGEDPTEWVDLFSEEPESPTAHSLYDFFEYQAANDASFHRPTLHAG